MDTFWYHCDNCWQKSGFAAVITKLYTVTMAALDISFPPAALPNGPITASEQINYRNSSFRWVQHTLFWTQRWTESSLRDGVACLLIETVSAGSGLVRFLPCQTLPLVKWIHHFHLNGNIWLTAVSRSGGLMSENTTEFIAEYRWAWCGSVRGSGGRWERRTNFLFRWRTFCLCRWMNVISDPQRVHLQYCSSVQRKLPWFLLSVTWKACGKNLKGWGWHLWKIQHHCWLTTTDCFQNSYS